MKFLVLCLALAAATAEPPRFRNARFRFQRQQLAPTTTESASEPTTESSGDGSYSPAESGPYPPSGWKPSGQAFTLPGEQSSPSDSYGAPVKQDAAPSDTYGSPANQDAAPSDAYGAPQKSGPYPPSGWKPSGQAFTLPAKQDAQSPPATSYGVPDNSYGPPDNEYGAPTTTGNDSATDDATSTDNPQAVKSNAVDVQKVEGTYYVLLPNGQLQKVRFMTEEDPQSMAYSAKLQYPMRNRAPLFVFNP